MLRLSTGSPDFSSRFSELLSKKREISEDVDEVVRTIISNVRTQGDKALLAYTNKFDKRDISVDGIAISKSELKKLTSDVSGKTIDALKYARDRIRSYHERMKPENDWYADSIGVELGARWTALESVGLYVPGGTASYPSSVIMNAVPAKVAGVGRIAMVVPCPDGETNPLVFAAAELMGIDEIYTVGGAQAVAALAFGTETIAPVAKIVGPGNAYVAAAKRQVFGLVGIDMIAGPSEVLIVADADSNPDWLAADLLAQAEHDPSSQSILLTDDANLADAVETAVEKQLKTLARSDIAGASWRDFGAIIEVAELTEASGLIDRIAPEHLELAIANPEDMLDQINNAGAIFLGQYTPEAIGDYVGGPNHILPTARSARFSSGLSVLDFMKRTSILKCNSENLRILAPMAMELAESEQLQAHKRSISIRLNS